MKLWKHIIGLILTIAGVASVNAVPFVPHHHHEGKICVDFEDENDGEHSDRSTASTAHSEEGDFDIPRGDIRLDCTFQSEPIDISSENIIDKELLTSQVSITPEKSLIFRQYVFLAESGGYRGSPSIS